MNIVKAYIGSALPYASKCAGVYASLIGLAVLAFLSNYTMVMLMKMKRQLISEKETQRLLVDPASDGVQPHAPDSPSSRFTSSPKFQKGVKGAAGGDGSAPRRSSASSARAHKNGIINNGRDHSTSISASSSASASDAESQVLTASNKERPLTSSKDMSYEQIAYYALGPLGRSISVFAIVSSNLGISVGYTLFVGKTIASALSSSLIKHVGGLDINYAVLMVLPLVILLCMPRTTRYLAFFSTLGNLTTLFVLGVVVGYSSSNIDGSMHFEFIRISTLPTFFGISVFAFTLHGVILSIEDGMQSPEDGPKVMSAATTTVGLIYMVFSFIGFAAYQDGIDSSILSNLPSNVLVIVAELTLCFSMCLSLPFFNYSIFTIVEDKLKWSDDGSATAESIESGGGADEEEEEEEVEEDDEDERDASRNRESTHSDAQNTPLVAAADGKRQRKKKRRRRIDGDDRGGDGVARGKKAQQVSMLACVGGRVALFRAAVCAGVTLVAMLLGPLFSEVISLVGSFSMALLAFILPPIFNLRIFKGQVSKPVFAFNIFILVFGVVGLCVASTISVLNMISYFKTGNDTSC